MNKKVWSIELNEDDYCWVSPAGIFLDTDCKDEALISYKEQIVDIYMEISKQNLKYKITLQKGGIWGPGTLLQMSDMTLKFVMK